jgi:tetratricopeptide (TPR) repeat protein
MQYQLGDYSESKRWIAEGLALAQKMGDPNLTTFGISSLVETEHALGQLDEMEALLRGGIQLAADNGNRFTYAMLQEQLAMVLHSTGKTGEAQQLCQASVALYR